MNFRDSFALVTKCATYIPYDFYIAKFPVTISAAAKIKLGDEKDHSLYKTTWLHAARFCNLLSRRANLQSAHHCETGCFVEDSHGGILLTKPAFRLPTPQEWEYAATGWSGSKPESYAELQRRIYKVPYVDYPTAQEQKQAFEEGYSTIQELPLNHIGIYGMLGYAKEWCCPAETYADQRNQVVKWEEYYTNYDNKIGYQTVVKNGSDNEVHVFRVVFPCQK